MKHNFLKSTVSMLMIAMLAFITVFTTSCKDDDDDKPTPILTEDGYYVMGAGTAATAIDIKAIMKPTYNESNGEMRAELLELYIAVKAGTEGFNIVSVSGSTQTTYGAGTDFVEITGDDLDGNEPQDGLWKGDLTATDTKFTVPEDGLYHVILDTELNKVAIARAKWGVIGGATPNGWNGNTVFTAPTFDLNAMTYVIEEIAMLEDIFKFRYSNGWKIFLSDDITANTNFGGAVNALVPGGGDISNTTYGIYKYTFTWKLGSPITIVEDWVKDGPVLATYPEAMYVVGGGVAYGWPGDPWINEASIMHKIAGGDEGVYWKICHIEAGAEFKLSAANWDSPNLGHADVTEFDANGVTVTAAGDDGNMSVATAGMYMIVLDLRNDVVKVSISEPLVYGIGDAAGAFFGTNDWDEEFAANKFTVDNTAKTLISPALPVDGSIRMYVDHAWIPAWWNSEFNVFSGVIEYRNDGGDQAAVTGTAGQVITLTFDDNTGAIN